MRFAVASESPPGREIQSADRCGNWDDPLIFVIGKSDDGMRDALTSFGAWLGQREPWDGGQQKESQHSSKLHHATPRRPDFLRNRSR